MERSAKRAFPFEAFENRRPRSVTGVRVREGGEHSVPVGVRHLSRVGAMLPTAALSEVFISYCDRVALMVDLKTAALVVSHEGVPTVIGWSRRGATPEEQAKAEDEVLAQFETHLRERSLDPRELVTYLSLVPPSTGMIRFERMKARPVDWNLLQFMAVRLSIELHRKDWRP